MDYLSRHATFEKAVSDALVRVINERADAPVHRMAEILLEEQPGSRAPAAKETEALLREEARERQRLQSRNADLEARNATLSSQLRDVERKAATLERDNARLDAKIRRRAEYDRIDGVRNERRDGVRRGGTLEL